MIFVDRSTVPPPAILLTRGAKEMAQARVFYAIEEAERRQQRFNFSVYRHRDVLRALDELFHGKCAYCESRMSTPLGVEHFRPKSGVVRPDGTLLPDHYWWLALEWDNLYLVCVVCNQRHSGSSIGAVAEVAPIVGKGDRFPLEDERTRAPLLADSHELAAERPLLLDPCRDHPEKDLVFLENGTVVSDTPRGQATIEVLGLNRPELVAWRSKAAETTQLLLQVVDELSATRSADRQLLQRTLQRVSDMTRSSEEYAGLKRQLVGTFRASLGDTHPAVAGADQLGGVVLSDSKRRHAKTSHSKFVAAQEEYSLADRAGDEVYRSVARRIQRIVIRNVKAIQLIDLDLGRSRAATAPWTVLLGENATGKSTILQVLALALIGKEEVERLELDPAEFIRDAPNVMSGSVDVYLTGSRRSRRLVFGRDGIEFIRSEQPQTLVLGYGETRLLPSPGLLSASGSRSCRVEGLFRPARALTDAEAWLLKAKDDQFDYVGGSLQDLLNLPRRDWLKRSDRAVWVEESGRALKLTALSTGYQSLLATVIDILELTLALWPTPESAEGIVLLDEIGAHLHPTWKMRVVSGLRRMLPAMQFITTTHEPLCLRGVSDGEVVLMKRDSKDRAYATVDLPSPSDLRVDQLLTSKHFGLSTTLDPDIDKLFDEYYQLLSREDSELPQTKRDRRDELAVRLRGQGVLGYTRRDQLVYEAIDRFLAEEQRAESEHGAKRDTTHLAVRREETLRRVADLWSMLTEPLEVGSGGGQG